MIGEVYAGVDVPPVVRANVRRMRSEGWARDEAMNRVRMVRRGEFGLVWPDYFNEQFPTAIVANFTDVAARDLAATLSPLPSLACSSGNMHTAADKRRAEKKNRIAASYWRHSRLEFQMKYGADQYLTYGFLPFWIEADYKNKTPLIHVEDPVGAYFDLNRRLECERYARCWTESLDKLAALFPEYAHRILFRQDGNRYEEQSTEVVRYVDDTWVVMYLPQRGNLAVAAYQHGQAFTPVHIALRPGVEMDPRGQFDDVLWVQLAHAVMAALTLEAGHKAVQAPLVVPNDTQELSFGPDAVIQTDNPAGVGRVALNVPQSAFALGEQLQQEMKEGAGYPDTRLGTGPAGGSTGRGISALEGGFDTQIKLGQDVLALAYRSVTSMALQMDATTWPRTPKTINGTLSGESYEVTYTPGADIGTNFECDVSFGFAAGLSPNSAIVTLLQLRGDNIIGRDTFRRQLPFDIDVDQQQRELDEQQLEDAVMQGLAAALQASGQMFAQGMSQQAVTFYSAAVEIIRGRRAGKDMADLIDQVLVQPVQEQVAQQQAAQRAQQQAGPPDAGGDALAGVQDSGLPDNVAPGQAGLPPGGRPSIQQLTAGFSGGGQARLGDTINRRIPTG